MNIAIVGTGGIGSTFAFQLAQAGHAVTVVARGARLARLEADRAIVLVTGERAAVTPSPALDPAVPYDLVLVTVLASQVDAVLPALTASAAKTVMYMFNTFEPLDRLRDAVGAGRFAFGFPAVLAVLLEGRLKRQIVSSGQVTTVGDAAWARVFTDAGIPTLVHGDMHSWLRSHAAFVVPFMVMASAVGARGGAGITWGEARAFAAAWDAGFALVRHLGNAITPGAVVAMSRLPTAVVASALWAVSRTAMARELSALGPGEVRTLIDQMAAAAPGRAAPLVAIRP
jgi:2-dehydropantoate 2-reductase